MDYRFKRDGKALRSHCGLYAPSIRSPCRATAFVRPQSIPDLRAQRPQRRGAYFGVAEDMTERNRVEDQLRQAQENGGRLATFDGCVRHDFNKTPDRHNRKLTAAGGSCPAHPAAERSSRASRRRPNGAPTSPVSCGHCPASQTAAIQARRRQWSDQKHNSLLNRTTGRTTFRSR